VEGNPVFIYHDAFNPNIAEIDDLKTRYREGTVTDVEVKEKLTIAINHFLAPIHERRERYMETGLVDEIIVSGTETVREITRATLFEMKKAMGLTGVWNRIKRKAEDRAKKIQKA